MSPRRSLFLALLILGLGAGNGCAHKPAAPLAASVSDKAAYYAQTMTGKPYRYGGNTPQGFDCSGLVQYSYARAGIKLPHGTQSLRRLSRSISTKELRRGDLLFFNQEGKRASHVAVYLGNDRFVHAPSAGKNVYVSSLAESYWQRHLADARRLETY
jgi:cell wall-associated NlpC family hydrolase